MTIVQGIILIAALVFLAMDHTRIIIENKRLWRYIEQDEATRSRNIYIKTKEEDDLIDYFNGDSLVVVNKTPIRVPANALVFEDTISNVFGQLTQK